MTTAKLRARSLFQHQHHQQEQEQQQKQQQTKFPEQTTQALAAVQNNSPLTRCRRFWIWSSLVSSYVGKWIENHSSTSTSTLSSDICSCGNSSSFSSMLHCSKTPNNKWFVLPTSSVQSCFRYSFCCCCCRCCCCCKQKQHPPTSLLYKYIRMIGCIFMIIQFCIVPITRLLGIRIIQPSAHKLNSHYNNNHDYNDIMSIIHNSSNNNDKKNRIHTPNDVYYYYYDYNNDQYNLSNATTTNNNSNNDSNQNNHSAIPTITTTEPVTATSSSSFSRHQQEQEQTQQRQQQNKVLHYHKIPLHSIQVSVIVMNHARPSLLLQSSMLLKLLYHPSVSEIIICHSNPNTSFNNSHLYEQYYIQYFSFSKTNQEEKNEYEHEHEYKHEHEHERQLQQPRPKQNQKQKHTQQQVDYDTTTTSTTPHTSINTVYLHNNKQQKYQKRRRLQSQKSIKELYNNNNNNNINNTNNSMEINNVSTTNRSTTTVHTTTKHPTNNNHKEILLSNDEYHENKIENNKNKKDFVFLKKLIKTKIKHINAIETNKEYGLALRFHYCSVSATNQWIVHVDDDINFKIHTITKLIQEMIYNPKRIIGHYGRLYNKYKFWNDLLSSPLSSIFIIFYFLLLSLENIFTSTANDNTTTTSTSASHNNLKISSSSFMEYYKYNGYDTKQITGQYVEVVLTKLLIVERTVCTHFFKYKNLVEHDIVLKESVPKWNGEDIFLNLVANYYYSNHINNTTIPTTTVTKVIMNATTTTTGISSTTSLEDDNNSNNNNNDSIRRKQQSKYNNYAMSDLIVWEADKKLLIWQQPLHRINPYCSLDNKRIEGSMIPRHQPQQPQYPNCTTTSVSTMTTATPFLTELQNRHMGQQQQQQQHHHHHVKVGNVETSLKEKVPSSSSSVTTATSTKTTPDVSGNLNQNRLWDVGIYQFWSAKQKAYKHSLYRGKLWQIAKERLSLSFTTN